MVRHPVLTTDSKNIQNNKYISKLSTKEKIVLKHYMILPGRPRGPAFHEFWLILAGRHNTITKFLFGYRGSMILFK